MKNLFCLLLIFLALNSVFLLAEQIEIREIIIIGNDVTDPSIVQYYLTFYEGQKLNILKAEQEIKDSEKRLYDLGYFDKVNIYFILSEDQKNAKVIVEIKEGYPYFYYITNDSFVIGKNNLGGKGIAIAGGIGFTSQQLFFFTPYLWKFPLSLYSSIQRSRSVIELQDTIVKYPHLEKYVLTIGAIKKKIRFQYGIATQVEAIKLGRELMNFNRTLGIKHTGVVSNLQLFWEIDLRDSSRKPTRGWSLNVNYVVGMELSSFKNYSKFWVSSQHNVQLTKRSILSLRNNLGFSSVSTPYFYLYNIISIDKVRTGKYFHPIGNNIFSISQEMRHFFNKWLEGLVFFDVGMTWNSYSNLNFSNLNKGWGLGVRIYISPPVNQIVNLMYGINPDDSTGRVFFNISFSF